jgi:hypothetical protein
MNFDKNREKNCDMFLMLKTRKFYTSEKLELFDFYVLSAPHV